MIVQAHRGLSAEHPENTIAAFRAAAEAGFDAIELDVRLTHDGEVVVLHDASIARTTDGTGRVGDLDYDELAHYDTGVGPVPRLDDAFSELADWQGTWNIELKDAAAAHPVERLVQHHHLQARVLITSMDPDALVPIQDLEKGFITLGPPDQEDRDEARAAGCGWLNADHDFVTKKMVRQCREAGFMIGAWTVNDIGAAERLMDLGVDAIITDRRDVLEACRARQD